ncbi:metal ABC transporter permease [Cohnella sp. AR92]|uniref:metal ABC transporter permease n=1 Tax=Cohnella sp. AR92 TaxID=648716 RepID=UPI000F8EF164|nr:metal ABC transporter permease [Cohnella sp. AR92]RUS47054.1 metal ABC transporter permease [Cohnella sp. AR92]
MEMLQYDFMRRALLAGGIVALIASALGVYLLLRRQAMMADMLSHVSLAGVALGIYLKWNPTLSGLAVAVLGAVAVEWIRRTYKSYSELSVAIIMVGGLSVSMILMSMGKGLNKGFTAYLFGSIVAVNPAELLYLLAASGAGGAFCLLFRRWLYLISFDEETAQASGIPVAWLSMGFSMLVGAIVASAIPIVGVLLLSSLIVLPAALAIRIAPSFRWAILLSMGTGFIGTLGGISASYQLSSPPGATIAFVLLLMLILGITGRRVLLRLRRHSKKTLNHFNYENAEEI